MSGLRQIVDDEAQLNNYPCSGQNMMFSPYGYRPVYSLLSNNVRR
jgi:hypothetical protein